MSYYLKKEKENKGRWINANEGLKKNTKESNFWPFNYMHMNDLDWWKSMTRWNGHVDADEHELKKAKCKLK